MSISKPVEMNSPTAYYDTHSLGILRSLNIQTATKWVEIKIFFKTCITDNYVGMIRFTKNGLVSILEFGLHLKCKLKISTKIDKLV